MQAAQTAAQKGDVINIVARLGETTVFPVLVHPQSDQRVFRATNEEKLDFHPTGKGISVVDPAMEGVSRHRRACQENPVRRQIECTYDVQWKSCLS